MGLMGTLINEFSDWAELSRSGNDFEASEIYETMASHSNNCHQMTPQGIYDYLNGIIEFLEKNNEFNNRTDVFENIREILESNS